MMTGAAGAEAAERSGMLREVATGLARPQKEISPKYFYDHRGSELFEAITQLPEYYPTRTEWALLDDFVPAWIRSVAPETLVELGAGAAEKTRILLDAMAEARPGATYVPIDISGEFLKDAAAGLRSDYPSLAIRPVTADISTGLPLPADVHRPAVFALLGGTIGNFHPARAIDLLGRIRAEMHPDDRLLLGTDLVKPAATLEAAYNDSAGVTAEFNRNVLHVLNRELNADFQPDAFRHRAYFNAPDARIEMHLVATRPMVVTIPGARAFRFAEGESIRTEVSYKYDRARVETMFADARLSLEHWVVGDPGFALSVARARLTPRTAS